MHFAFLLEVMSTWLTIMPYDSHYSLETITIVDKNVLGEVCIKGLFIIGITMIAKLVI